MPLISLDTGEARKMTAPAKSSGSAHSPPGIRATPLLLNSEHSGFSRTARVIYNGVVLDHIAACLCGALFLNPARASKAGIAGHIQKHANDGVFLILSADSIDASVLADVSNTWPALCVFLYSEQMDDQQLAREFPQVQPIDPPLGAAEGRSLRPVGPLCKSCRMGERGEEFGL